MGNSMKKCYAYIISLKNERNFWDSLIILSEYEYNFTLPFTLPRVRYMKLNKSHYVVLTKSAIT